MKELKKTNQASPILKKRTLDVLGPKPYIQDIIENLSSVSPEYDPAFDDNDNLIVKSMTVYPLEISSHYTLNVKTGVKFNVCPGYNINGKLFRTWSSHGLFLSDVYLENGELILQIVNLGLDAIVIPDKTEMAEIWLEPKATINF